MAQQRPDPLIGREIGGALIEQRISKGLMANVYRGRLAEGGEAVGVKVLSPRAVHSGAVSPERFMREGRVISSLGHPNIIKCHSMGVDGGSYFITMEWLEDGANLHQIASDAFIAPRRSLLIVREIADALQYLHDNGLVHRDIKPANIWLLSTGRPMIMDFSIIKPEGTDIQLTAPGTIMGTVNYMPPEQAQPDGPYGRVTGLSDLYSLGATLYWMLTGQAPFVGRTPMETIIKLLREKVEPPSNKNPRVTPELDALCLAAIAKKPQDRPASCRDLIVQIEKLLTAGAAESGQPAIKPPPLSSATIKPTPPLDPMQAALEAGRRESSGAHPAVVPDEELSAPGEHTGLTPVPVDQQPVAAIAEAPGAHTGLTPVPGTTDDHTGLTPVPGTTDDHTGLTPVPVSAPVSGDVETKRQPRPAGPPPEAALSPRTPTQTMPDFDGDAADEPTAATAPMKAVPIRDGDTMMSAGEADAGALEPAYADGDDTDHDLGDDTDHDAADTDDSRPPGERTELDLDGPAPVSQKPVGTGLYEDAADEKTPAATEKKKSDSAKPVLFMNAMERNRSDSMLPWLLVGLVIFVAGSAAIYWLVSAGS